MKEIQVMIKMLWMSESKKDVYFALCPWEMQNNNKAE